MEGFPGRFKKVLKGQLGRLPKGNYRVVRLCRHGFPQVIQNPPLFKGKPMPTLFWLTCPFLRREISRLEEAGHIEHFEKKVKRNARFRGKYLKAHALERSVRKALLPSGLPPKVKFKLISTGVGGIENPLGVKCLHLHAASYLALQPNPIGEEVVEKLLKCVLNCKNGQCKRFLKEKRD